MKRAAFAVLWLGAVGSAHAQSKVEIYGIATAGLGYVDKIATSGSSTGSRLGVDSGQYTQSRLGFRGTEDLGSGMSANFVIEGGLTMDNGASGQGGATFGRRTTIGLKGGFGSLELGRRKDYTDFIAQQYATTTRMLPFTGKVHGNNLDRATGERANNMAYYLTPEWSGLQANLALGMGEAAGSSATGQSLGFGANYRHSQFAFGFAYWQSKKAKTVGSATTNSSSDQGAASNAGCNTDKLGNAGDICTKIFMAGGSYNLGDLKLRGEWSNVKQPLINTASGAAPNFLSSLTAAAGAAPFTAGGINNSKVNIVDVGVDYKKDAWLLKASVIQSRYDFVGANKDGKLNVLAVGADYSLSKRSLLYAMLGNMKASHMYSPGLTSNGAPGGDRSQNALALGVYHRF